jgi:hypothetical protein
MIARNVQNRFRSASEALEALDQWVASASPESSNPHLPAEAIGHHAELPPTRVIPS